MSTMQESLWDFLNNLGKEATTHLRKRADKAAGLMPDGMPTMPGLPAMPPMPSMPVMMMPAMGGAGAGAVMPQMPGRQTQPVSGSYSDQVADGVACLSCTRGHLVNAQTAAKKALQALDADDPEEARRQWALVAAEYDALTAYDWAPEKLAQTPEKDLKVVRAVEGCVTTARGMVGTPYEAGLAAGSAAENQRFAISRKFTERDAAEIVVRHKEIDSAGNYLERSALARDTSPDAKEAKNSLREARHTLDRAKAQEKLYDPDIWAEAQAQFEAAAAALTTTPTREQAQALAAQCTECATVFYGQYFQK